MQKILDSSRNLFSRVLRDKLTRDVGWLTGAEIVSRFGRIVAAVILARQLDAFAFGIAAIALTVFELIRVFTENGIGAAVIRASDEEFDRVANTAYALMWKICAGLACLQVFIGLIIEALLPGRQLGLMLLALSGVYLIMPFGVVHAYTLQRKRYMKQLATVQTSQAVTDHICTAALALLGAGAWAIVLPKLLSAPVWVLAIRYQTPWKRKPEAGMADNKEILQFSMPVLGAELLNAARDQLDKIIVSVVLGVEALGVYYFAFNAGLGISTALNRSFSNAFYPYLCASNTRARAFRKGMLKIGVPLASMYVVQAGAALFYVPIVFGENWASAASLVAILCLTGPARLMFDGLRMFARSQGATGMELKVSILFTISILASFSGVIVFGLYTAVLAMIASASLCVALFFFFLSKSPSQTWRSTLQEVTQ